MRDRHKWVYDGDRFAARAVPLSEELNLSHSELAEEALGRPGLAAADLHTGVFWFENSTLAYDAYHSPGRDVELERVMLQWVHEHTSYRPSRLEPRESAGDAWADFNLD